MRMTQFMVKAKEHIGRRSLLQHMIVQFFVQIEDASGRIPKPPKVVGLFGAIIALV